MSKKGKGSEQAERQRLVNQCCTDAQVDGGDGSEQKNHHGHWTAERILELLKLSMKGTSISPRNQGLEGDARSLLGTTRRIWKTG